MRGKYLGIFGGLHPGPGKLILNRCHRSFQDIMVEETWSMLETNGISGSMFVIQCYQNIEKLGLRLCVANEAF